MYLVNLICQVFRRKKMEIIDTVKGWVGKLAELGVSLLALGIIAELIGERKLYKHAYY